MHQEQGSTLSRTTGWFSHMLAGICMFLLCPFIEQNVRPDIFIYFARSFPSSVSVFCSWIFVALVTACGFFGVSAIAQVTVQFILRRSVRKAVF